jgi:hypothetical protein
MRTTAPSTGMPSATTFPLTGNGANGPAVKCNHPMFAQKTLAKTSQAEIRKCHAIGRSPL